MDNLRILSLGRNLIKKIENLDAVAETLEELWMSYNLVAGLVSGRGHICEALHWMQSFIYWRMNLLNEGCGG